MWVLVLLAIIVGTAALAGLVGLILFAIQKLWVAIGNPGSAVRWDHSRPNDPGSGRYIDMTDG